MVTENNSQINTFVKGMNSDTSYQMLDEQSYALAENLRLFSLGDGNKHGELRPIPGLKTAAKHFTVGIQRVLATASIRQYGIVIVKMNDKKWRVYRFKNIDSKDNGFSSLQYISASQTPGGDPGVLQPGQKPTIGKPDQSGLTMIFQSSKTTNATKFDVVTRYEDEDNIKLYIADGESAIMVLNIVDSSIMLTEDDISSFPSVYFSKPVFEGYVSGTLKSGLVQYSYRLYRKNSVYTSVSPSTALIQIYGQNDRGLLEGKESGRGVKLSINVGDKNNKFTHIIIYRIHYSINGQNPQVTIVADQQLDNKQITFIDDGVNPLETITLEEYNSFQGLHIIPQTIESQNDYLFAGCIKNEDGIVQNDDINNWDARAYSYNTSGYARVGNYTEDVASHLVFTTKKTDGRIVGYVRGETEVHPENTDGYCTTHNVQNDDYNYIYQSDGKTIGGEGVNVSWKLVHKYSSNTVPTAMVDGTPKFSINASDTQEEVANKIKRGISRNFADRRSLRRGELYRYGIVLYDKFGTTSPVKWIADIKVPDLNTEKAFELTEGGLYSIPLGIEFTVNLPASAYGYEIVRCNRGLSDIKTISQGVLSKPGFCFEYNSDKQITVQHPYTPTGYITTNDITINKWIPDNEKNSDSRNATYSTTKNTSLYQFISPEVCYNKDSIGMYVQNQNLKLQAVKYIWSNKPGDGDPIYYAGSGVDEVRKMPNQCKTLLGQFSIDNSINTDNSTFTYDAGFLSHGDADFRKKSDTISKALQKKKTNVAYCKLYNSAEITSSAINQVNNATLATDSKQDEFLDGAGEQSIPKYMNNSITCGDASFCNWIVGTAYGLDSKYIVKKDRVNTNVPGSDEDEQWRIGLNVFGIGGRCMLLNVEHMYNQVSDTKIGGTILCNLQHDVIPYGGYSSYDKSFNTYYSYGNYSSKYDTTMTVFDGDCYVDVFEYVSSHKLYCPQDAMTIPSMSIIYAIPVETNINLALTSGYEFSRESDEYKSSLQIEPSNVYDTLIQSKPMYEYNTVYSSSPKSRIFESELKDKDDYNKQFDYRVRHSNLKSNDERLDSWLRFQSADYIDVDTKHGKITNLKSHGNRLYFWQKNAVGMLSVNERTVMNTENNMPLIIGEGGVLSRYDYIDEHSGMYEQQFCTTESSNLLYYFDCQNNTIKAIQGGTIVDLPSTKNVKNTMIKNKSNTNEPILFFDHEYHEMIANVFKDKAIVYNEKITAFTSLYTIGFDGVVQFPNRTYLVKSDTSEGITVSQWNILDGTNPKGFGDSALNIKLQYVVNKNPVSTKVFDNQEIVTSNPSDANFDELQYRWTTDLNTSTTDQLMLTEREGNFRYAIPRSGNALYGNRIRGKYMVCDIEGAPRSEKTSISYIITKLRGSLS